MEVTAITRNVRLSASKGHSIARAVQGKRVSEALNVTQFSPRKAAVVLGKTIQSAMANAKNNVNVDADDLVVSLAVFDEGPRLRRYWPRARGSASPILRRLCHVKVVLTDGR
ncbi:MAG: 50S ribosomal protein L22 [Lentisphaerae bacterium]|jgi:large subunit ribosomal protein L22|nr:50S ribosomal protein L22 [Lentisphaerota bacterium]